MKVYISVDMEGISGVTSGGLTRTGSAEWQIRGRQMLMDDINAAIEGALAAGATSFVVSDAHDSHENIMLEKLHPAARLVSGSPRPWGQMHGLDVSFDAAFLVGYHAMMGTHNGQFDHTISTASIGAVRLNGRTVGEIGINAAIAGFFGVPILLVTGDSATAHESRELLEDVETVSVKQAYGRWAIDSAPLEEAHRLIREGARNALRRKGQPWQLDAPVRVEVDFLRSAEADMAQMVPGSIRTGGRTVEYRHDDFAVAFQGLQAMIALGGIAASRWARGLYTQGNQASL